jgi:hypothetical protein
MVLCQERGVLGLEPEMNLAAGAMLERKSGRNWGCERNDLVRRSYAARTRFQAVLEI